MFTVKSSNLLSLLLIFSSTSALAAPAQTQCEDILASQVILYRDDATILSEESRPTVTYIRRTLEKIDNLAKSNISILSFIYSKIQNEIDAALKFARELETKDRLLQNQVHLLAHQFSLIVDFPSDYTNDVGYYADGFDYVDRFTNQGFDERADEFKRRFGSEPTAWLLDRWATKTFPEKFKKRPRFGLNEKNEPIHRLDRKVEPQQFFFQYKYIALPKDRITMRTHFAERETGNFYYGVSQRSRADYDTQHGSAESYLEDAAFKGTVRRTQDALLFADLGITDLKSAQKLKQETQNLLSQRIIELDKVSDPQLRSAIEAILFYTTYQRGNSYPLQVNQELKNAEKYNKYIKAGVTSTKEVYYGEKFTAIIGDRAEELFTQAVKWVFESAKKDSAAIKTRLGYSLK